VKLWKAGAIAGGTLAGLATIGWIANGRRRRNGRKWTTLGQPETDAAWTAPNVDPGFIPISGPTHVPIPERYWRLGLAIAGVAPEMMRARVSYRPGSPVPYWLDVAPKQAGVTTISIVDSTGTLAHVALEQEVA
jgi:hypothetical protein